MREMLLNKIESKSLTVGVIGLGYVGLPLSLRFAEAGFSVLGFDIDESKVAMLNEGTSYIKHIGPEGLKVAVTGAASQRQRTFPA